MMSYTHRPEPRKQWAHSTIRKHWGPRLIAWDKLTEEELESHRRVCFACRWSQDTPLRLHRAHIQPRTMGGSDELENIHLLCGECHTASEHWTGERYWEWFHERSFVDRALQRAANQGLFNLSALFSDRRDELVARAIARMDREIDSYQLD